jgi:dihydropteroate synthase
MGILNVTPDSFHDGGRFNDKNLAVERAYRLRDDGAHKNKLGGAYNPARLRPANA